MKDTVTTNAENLIASPDIMASLRRDNFGRYVCCLFAKPLERELLFQFFVWVEEIDEIKFKVSEPMLGHVRIQWWREVMEATLEGQHASQPFLALLVKQKKLSQFAKGSFEIFLSACEKEIDGFIPENLNDLEDFISHKYGSVLTMALSLLGDFENRTKQAIHHVALAYGHLDLLLKAPQLARKNCIMLPRDLLTEAEINADEAPLTENKKIVTEITLYLISRAKAQLSQARSFRKYINRDALPVLFHACLTDDSIRLIRKYRCSIYSIYPRTLGVRTYIRLYIKALMKEY